MSTIYIYLGLDRRKTQLKTVLHISVSESQGWFLDGLDRRKTQLKTVLHISVSESQGWVLDMWLYLKDDVPTLDLFLPHLERD